MSHEGDEKKEPGPPQPSASAGGRSSSAHSFPPVGTGTPPGATSPGGGGLWRTRNQRHVPVMVAEIVDLLSPVPAGTVVDATVGDGGHAEAILDAYPHLHVLGLDRDPTAVEAAEATLARFVDRAHVRQARFDSLSDAVAGLATPVVATLFDLGVRSAHFDEGARGFSYRHDAPLDMRMDPAQVTTAADVVNGWDEADLARMLAVHGEGRFARRLAHAIVQARPLTTTTQLSTVISQAIPAAARRREGHPARRVFQAVRVAVNEELDVLQPALEQAIDVVVPAGRILVLAYHSGEDRIVKSVFTNAVTGGCTCPPRLPCRCGAVPKARFVFRGARRPAPSEVERNRRASSARLRVVERVTAGNHGVRTEGSR